MERETAFIGPSQRGVRKTARPRPGSVGRGTESSDPRTGFGLSETLARSQDLGSRSQTDGPPAIGGRDAATRPGHSGSGALPWGCDSTVTAGLAQVGLGAAQ